MVRDGGQLRIRAYGRRRRRERLDELAINLQRRLRVAVFLQRSGEIQVGDGREIVIGLVRRRGDGESKAVERALLLPVSEQQPPELGLNWQVGRVEICCRLQRGDRAFGRCAGER